MNMLMKMFGIGLYDTKCRELQDCGCTDTKFYMYAKSRLGYASGHVKTRVCPLNGEENGARRISPLALFHAAPLRAGGFFAEPLLSLDKHVAVGEHLHNVAQEAVRRQSIPPPEHALSGFEFAAALEESKLGRRLHPAEHLPNCKLLVEEESLHQRRGDGDGARRDAGRLAVA